MAAVTDTPRRLDVPLSAVDRIAFGPMGEPVPPHLLRLLVSTALATRSSSPICVLLPSAIRVAPTVAILAALECQAFDLPDNRGAFVSNLSPGQKVRLYPTGEVFEIDKVGDVLPDATGVRVRLPSRRTRESGGTRIVQTEKILWFEPTLRHRPPGTGRTRFEKPPVNDLDALVGSQVFGNTGLVKTRVFLAATRTEFERTLREMVIVPRDGSVNFARLADVFAFGGVDADGIPYVIEPSGADGQPMVAVTRDLLDLEAACMAPDIERGSRVVLADSVEGILKDLDLAGRIGERQRLILFADARNRAELAPFRARGWTVWEPSPGEILGHADPPTEIGCAGIDRSRRGARSELRGNPGLLACNAPLLRNAEDALVRLGGYLSEESVEHDAWVEDVLDTAQALFFSTCGWLLPPSGATRVSAQHAEATLRSSADRLARYLGTRASIAVTELADAVEQFSIEADSSGITPKGAEILKLARACSGSSLRQPFVTGSRQSREDADALFGTHGLDTRSLSISELPDAGDCPSIVVFSVMRRDIFEKLMDPWPAAHILFVGYDFEIDCYRRRLGRRETLRAMGRIDRSRLSDITGLPPTAFDVPTASASPPQATLGADERLDDFDRATRRWNWTRRIVVPDPSQGEAIHSARIVRFVGRSWMAMTEDHRPIQLSQGGGANSTSAYDANVGDLVPGSRIVVRDGGDRDVIRLMAEELVGKTRYATLRDQAALWQVALRSVPGHVRRIAAILAAAGVRRHPATIRSWLANSTLIAPRSERDIVAIASAFPVPGKSSSDWTTCHNAIAELRGLHISAGARLTDLLATRCGAMLFEPSDRELAVDLGIGIVWVLEVASIESEPRECPASYVNRLQWLEPTWRDQLLNNPVREAEA